MHPLLLIHSNIFYRLPKQRSNPKLAAKLMLFEKKPTKAPIFLYSYTIR